MSKYIAYVGKNCVACGACMNICPRQAIQIKMERKRLLPLLLVWGVVYARKHVQLVLLK